MKNIRFFKYILLGFILIYLLIDIPVLFSKQVSQDMALTVATNYLNRSNGIAFSSQTRNKFKISSITPHYNSNEMKVYYVVNLLPTGYIIIAADDRVDPIIAFSVKSNFFNNDNNFSDLLFSLPVEKILYSSSNKTNNLQRNLKWNKYLLSIDKESLDYGTAEESINEIFVKPFILSEWNQGTASGVSCYNWYTPTNSTQWVPGLANNYPCGCAVTATAQVIRYYKYPISEIGPIAFQVKVDHNSIIRTILGGNENGGNYDWDKMVLKPDRNTPEDQRKAIGALIHDIAISSYIHFSASDSETFLSKIHNALKSTFKYKNAIFTIVSNSYQLTDDFSRFNRIVNTNLDAGYPVIFALSGSAGHTVVCDGYGYNDSTPFYHINIGWGGFADGWYNLPSIIIGSRNFNRLFSCIYNIFPENLGEIISGRLFDLQGEALEGIKLLAVSENGEIFSTYSKEKGIFAFNHVPSNSKFTIKCGDYVGPTVLTGKSGEQLATEDEVGNVWQINFNIPKLYTVRGTFSGIKQAYIPVQVSGDAQINIISLPNGEFSFRVPPGKYTVKPMLADAAVSPISQTIIVTDKSVSMSPFLVDTYFEKFTSGSVIQFNLNESIEIDKSNIKNLKFYVILNNQYIKLKQISSDAMLPQLLFSKNISLMKSIKKSLKKDAQNFFATFIPPLGIKCSIFVKGKTADRQSLNIKLVDAKFVPPEILEIKDSANQSSTLFGVGSEVTLTGRYFGKKIKKIFLFSIASKSFYKAKILKFYAYFDSKNRPSCMEPISGESLLKFRIPNTIPAGKYYILLDNKISIATIWDAKFQKQVIPQISIQK